MFPPASGQSCAPAHRLVSVRARRKFSALSLSLLLLSQFIIAPPARANSAVQIPSPSFSQDWSNTALISVDDDWSGVPGIVGYRGDGLTSSTGVNPQLVVAESTVVDVNANLTNPNTFTTGGVSEFQLANPVVALQGSGTARAPHILFNISTAGLSNVNVSYNLRDIDGSADNAVQPVALQYRVGATGNFTNIPAGFVADATTGPSLATLVTPVNVTLPAAAENQPLVQVRIITTDAPNSDEWVGVDDLVVTASGTPANNAPTINAPANPITTVTQGAAPFNVGLTGSDDGGVYQWGATNNGTGIAAVSVSGGQGTPSASFNVTLQPGFSGTASFTATLSDGVNAPASRTVNIAVTPLVANNPPSIAAVADPYTTVAQDAAPFAVSLSGADDNNVFNWSAAPVSGVSSVGVTAGQGTANPTYTVALQPGFSGTASFTATLSDGVNPQVSRTVNVAVTPAPANHLVISQVYGSGGLANAAFKNDYVEIYNPTNQTLSLNGWSVQYAAATGSGWASGLQSLAGPIAPGEYYLVKLGTNGSVGSDVPQPNAENTGINMSGTTGKIALVRNSEGLTGANAACPLEDPDLVDLVGYGTTANCREGGATTAFNAPAPGAGTAIFRKQNGATDTGVNSADFATGTPLPRRTAIILDGAPAVVSADTDSELGETAQTPVDATVLLTFSEPVIVTGTWYDLTCEQSGHHDTTLAAGPKTWAITTNSNFEQGEKCTFKVFASQVRDEDNDDAQPNTDFMAADFTQQYTVVTGALAPEAPEAHLALGNPSGAAADALNSADNYLMSKPEYALSYNRSRGTANWVSWHLDDSWKGPANRIDTFRPDPTLPADWYHVQHLDYSQSGFDRGHMTPSDDRDLSLPVNQATFLMTNIIPQAGDNNQGPWANMESYLRTLLTTNELYIVAGGEGTGGTGANGFATTIANGKVTVPANTWKVVLVLPKGGGDDAARATCGARTIAVIMPNRQGIRNDDWHNYIVSVDQVETLTHYDFFSNLPDAVEACVEAGKDGANPPGTSGQSVMAEEDTAKAITLDAVGPDPNETLTYHIAAQPAHGTLSGTGANVVYTPAPEYKGGDSFKFFVTGAAGTSNTSTVTITVTEVNDAPVANADPGKTTAEDTALSFPAGDLLANDSAGAADEAGQTLTVAEVSAVAGATHGAVSLAGGQVTYLPEADYHGPASFSYKVCDDGATSGSPDPKCATATVSVTVTPVNDAPAAAADSFTTDEDVAVTFNVRANDSDVDGDTLAVASFTQPAHGVVTANPDGTLTFTPAADSNGVEGFGYTVSDGHGGTATANVTITVRPVNDAPVLGAIGNQSVALGNTLTFTAVGSDIDTAASGLTYSLTGAPENVSFNTATGAFSWTPTAAQAGHVYTFTVRVTDDGALFDEETFTVAVTYDWSGFLQPIGQDGSSVFKLGQTVPVKFRLTGASAAVNDAVARLFVKKLSDTVQGTQEVDAVSTSAATDDNLFRYADGVYIFNLSTKGLTTGTYQLRVDTGDGVARTVNISLR